MMPQREKEKEAAVGKEPTIGKHTRSRKYAKVGKDVTKVGKDVTHKKQPIG